MKQSVKGLAMIAILFLSTISVDAQIRYGLKAGLNLSYISGLEKMYRALAESTIPGYSTDYAPGSHAGFMLRYDFPSQFFLQPELLLSTQGLQESAADRKSETSRLNFLQLPVYAGYKMNAGSRLRIILAAGPYFAYGINGSEGAYGSEGMFQHFDAGLSVMAGIEIDQLQITAGCDAGLVDQVKVDGWKTAKDLLGLSSILNRNFKVSVGYFFSAGK
jgi:hypothetical protein